MFITYCQGVFPAMTNANHFPRMIEMEQSYPTSPKLDFASFLEQQFTQSGLRENIKPGMRIALGVGSRGITNLKEIVKATLGVLTGAGARPFIVRDVGGVWSHVAKHGRAHRRQYGGEKDWDCLRRP
jgi:hypothetical protein